LGTLLLQLAGVIEASGLVDRIKKGPALLKLSRNGRAMSRSLLNEAV
jgi:hypothetical protein